MSEAPVKVIVEIHPEHGPWECYEKSVEGSDSAHLTAHEYIRADLVDELVEALECLISEQNGPPLIKYQDSWEEAMKKAEAALAKVRGEKNG